MFEPIRVSRLGYTVMVSGTALLPVLGSIAGSLYPDIIRTAINSLPRGVFECFGGSGRVRE